jgi:hypothetical protein
MDGLQRAIARRVDIGANEIIIVTLDEQVVIRSRKSERLAKRHRCISLRFAREGDAE